MIYQDFAVTPLDVIFGTGDIAFRMKEFTDENGANFGIVELVQLPMPMGAGTVMRKEITDAIEKLPAQVGLCFPADDSKSLDAVINNLKHFKDVYYGIYFYTVIYTDSQYEDNVLPKGFSIKETLEEAEEFLREVESEFIDTDKKFKIVKLRLSPDNIDNKGSFSLTKTACHYEELE